MSKINLPKLPALSSNEINEACWKFIDAMPHELSGPVCNELKPALYAAMCPALQAYAEQAVREALAEMASAPVHKPAPVDTSSGHNADTVRTLWDLKERYRQGLDQQRRAGEAALEACRLVVERFGPSEHDYVFSKRMAIQRCRAALSSQPKDPPC